MSAFVTTFPSWSRSEKGGTGCPDGRWAPAQPSCRSSPVWRVRVSASSTPATAATAIIVTAISVSRTRAATTVPEG